MSEDQTALATRLLRLARIQLHLLHGVATALFILPHLTADQREQRIRSWSGKLLAILHIRVIAHGPTPDRGTARTLFVSNHISWIDIWALKQLHPMHFVAKSEVRTWPVIGWLADKTGTLFITREKRQDTKRAMDTIEQALVRGECLCFFPEGTTTDGTELQPFKSSLLQAAINAQAVVWPLAIHYPDPAGGPNTAGAYCGNITMRQSLWAVLKLPEIVVELRFAAPIAAHGQERRQLAHQARQAIASRLHLRPHKAPGTGDDLPDAAH